VLVHLQDTAELGINGDAGFKEASVYQNTAYGNNTGTTQGYLDAADVFLAAGDSSERAAAQPTGNHGRHYGGCPVELIFREKRNINWYAAG